MEFGEIAREALREKGLSLRAAARALNFDPAYLSRALSGRQRPSRALAEALDALLEQNGALAAAAPAPSPIPVLGELRPDDDMFGRLAAVTNGRARVDSQVFDWLERSLADHRRAEDEVGGEPLAPVIKAQLRTVHSLGQAAPAALRDQLVSLASQYAQFMAWIVNDLGDKAGAVAWYDRAHDWAMEAANPAMAATVLSMKAHIAWSLGDGPKTIRMGEAARWHNHRVSHGVDGMAAQMVARGHALVGDGEAARRALDEAQALISQAADRPEDEPDWMYFYGDDWFTAQRGMIELELGNGESAVQLLSQALDALPHNYRRDRAWYAACLAKAHSVAGDLDAASDLAGQTAPDALALNRYAVDELRGVAAVIDAKLPRTGRDLSEALRTT